MNIANPYLHKLNPEEIKNVKLRRWVCFASLAVALTLIVAKFAAYIITDSVSVMTSLMDSAFDALASTVTLLGVIHASTPADEEHRFGHGKLEALAAMGQALFIFGSAGYLFFESIHRFVQPQLVKAAHVGIGVMLLSIILTATLIAFQRYVIRRTKSVAISADHLHYKGDLLINLSVLVALAISAYSHWPYFDPLFAMAISLALLYGGHEISKESFGILMDREMSGEDRVKIERLVRTHPDVHAMHDLRTRYSGRQSFIEFHLELDGNMTLSRTHEITEEIEMILYREFPQSEVLIHQEPAGLDDHRLDTTIKASTP
ncbi:MAG: cation diffusion facilitator family transporter [Proteobacteria bacterium]|nr:cation diffusion facilitator family transporter [Pseudomonadota bacterium]